MSGQAPTVALGIRLLSELRLGARLVARRVGVAHVYRGPVTRSGAHVPASGSVMCGAKTRRLMVLVNGASSLGSGRRLCRRCAGLLPLFPDDAPIPVRLDDWGRTFGHLTIDDFERAAAWTRTVAETHQVGMLSDLVLGHAPFRPTDEAQRRRKLLEQRLHDRRRLLAAQSRTPEQVAADEITAAAATDRLARANRARARSLQVATALDRRARGRFLMPHERALLDEQASG